MKHIHFHSIHMIHNEVSILVNLLLLLNYKISAPNITTFLTKPSLDSEEVPVTSKKIP